MSTPTAPHRDMSEQAKTVLTNVRVFDGHRLREPGTVVIDGGVIGTNAAGARVLDAGGAVLLPGLIDAHVHLRAVEHLEQLCGFGVTTALDMAAWPPALVDSLRGVHGLTDMRSSGTPATTSGSTHSRIPGFPTAGFVDEPGQAAKFVHDRVAEGSDYIKIIVDIPGPDQVTLDALVTAARQHGKHTIAHAASYAAVRMALRAQVDMITHAPLDTALDQTTAARMATQGSVAIPTLAMMEGVVQQAGKPDSDYSAARASVTALHQAGVPILAGTDANNRTGGPATVRHGWSLHHELTLLVDAGLSTLDALRAATVLPAQHFGLPDRGTIEPGRRADLVLVDGDPLTNIATTRHIRTIWCGGVEHLPHAN